MNPSGDGAYRVRLNDSTRPARLYTIGHGDRRVGDLVRVLRSQAIETLVDIRSHPASRRHPQFDRRALQEELERRGMTYLWAGRQLGGLRRARSHSPHGALPEGLRGYADHMDSAQFARAITRLLDLAASSPAAVMCAERDPTHCHRSLLADHLSVVHGVEVIHLVDAQSRYGHRARPELRLVDERRLVYDRHLQHRLEFR